MVTNGDTAIFHKLFPEEDEQNMKDITPPFESQNNLTSPLENLTRNNLFYVIYYSIKTKKLCCYVS